jgi:hypothetical protein
LRTARRTQFPVDAVKDTFDVDIGDPVVTPAPLARRPDRVNRETSASYPYESAWNTDSNKGSRYPANNFLCEMIGDRWNT